MGATPEHLGIFGGTFDPPHIGHLILAETAADALRLDRVVFVPAAAPPHKQPTAIRATAAHRVAMTERAITGNPRFALSRIDIDRPGPHYTVDTLTLLAARHPAATFTLLIGADSLRDLPTWSRPARLIELAQLGVMRRPGIKPDLDALERAVSGLSARITWIDAPLIAIASSTLAAHIAAGRSVRYQIPDAVRTYIDTHGLYRTSS